MPPFGHNYSRAPIAKLAFLFAAHAAKRVLSSAISASAFAMSFAGLYWFIVTFDDRVWSPALEYYQQEKRRAFYGLDHPK
jgi:hypothetical protein